MTIGINLDSVNCKEVQANFHKQTIKTTRQNEVNTKVSSGYVGIKDWKVVYLHDQVSTQQYKIINDTELMSNYATSRVQAEYDVSDQLVFKSSITPLSGMHQISFDGN